jgi:hypothetical protein
MSRITFLKNSINTGFITRYGKKGQKVFNVPLDVKQRADFPKELKILENKKSVVEAEITRLTTEYENRTKLSDQAQANFNLNKNGLTEHELDKKET